MESISQYNEDVALFIDWENFKISLAGGHRLPNVSALKEEVANYGRVVVAKAYADWVSRAPELRGASQFTLDPPHLYAAGIEPVYVPTRLPVVGAPHDSTRTARVKNSVDVKMTADCIECAHAYANINTFVLVSGDSDFIHVINSLRTMGKRVVIIGVSWSTSRRLADQVDGLILYDVDVDPVVEPITEPEPARVENNRNTVRLSSPGRHQLPEVIKAIEDLVRSERQAGRTPLLTSLKQRLMRHIPGFDEKRLGFSGFKKMMLRVAGEGNVKLVTVGLVDWVMLSEEPDPPEAFADNNHHDEDAGQSPTAGDEVSGGDAAAEERQLHGYAAESGGFGAPAAEAAQVETDRVDNARVDVVPADTGYVDAAPVDGVRVDAAPVEIAAAAPAREYAEPVPDAAPARPELSGDSVEALAAMELPEGPGDGQDYERVIDLIVMADTLEHQEGVSHVAFNFLVSEVHQALEAGLEAEIEEISEHWGAMHSRTYITRLLRALGNGGMFKRGQHIDKDAETGRTRRRSTFYLDQEHGVVAQVLSARWPLGNGAEESGSEFLPSPEDPSAVEDVPSAVQAGPPAVEDAPSAVQEGPPAVEDVPSAVQEGPPAVEDVPSAVQEDPPAVEDEPSSEVNPEPEPAATS